MAETKSYLTSRRGGTVHPQAAGGPPQRTCCGGYVFGGWQPTSDPSCVGVGPGWGPLVNGCTGCAARKMPVNMNLTDNETFAITPINTWKSFPTCTAPYVKNGADPAYYCDSTSTWVPFPGGTVGVDPATNACIRKCPAHAFTVPGHGTRLLIVRQHFTPMLPLVIAPSALLLTLVIQAVGSRLMEGIVVKLGRAGTVVLAYRGVNLPVASGLCGVWLN